MSTTLFVERCIVSLRLWRHNECVEGLYHRVCVYDRLPEFGCF